MVVFPLPRLSINGHLMASEEKSTPADFIVITRYAVIAENNPNPGIDVPLKSPDKNIRFIQLLFHIVPASS